MLNHYFNQDGYGALINSSRAILTSWQKPEYQNQFTKEDDFWKAIQAATLDMKKNMLECLRNTKNCQLKDLP